MGFMAFERKDDKTNMKNDERVSLNNFVKDFIIYFTDGSTKIITAYDYEYDDDVVKFTGEPYDNECNAWILATFKTEYIIGVSMISFNDSNNNSIGIKQQPLLITADDGGKING